LSYSICVGYQHGCSFGAVIRWYKISGIQWVLLALKASGALCRPFGTTPTNARTLSKRPIRQIADSISTFGFINPILIDSRDTIIAGHGRMRAAQLLGIDQVPTIRLEALTEDQIRAYVIADNRLAENAGWDESILAMELQHLLTVDLGFEVNITGFEVPEIDLILDRAAGKLDPEDVAEPIPSGPAVTRQGDLWMPGKHRILCGNSLEENSYVRLIEGRKADVVFVDPPYNVAIDGHVSGNGSIPPSGIRDGLRRDDGEGIRRVPERELRTPRR
jgi:hypothetical protein